MSARRKFSRIQSQQITPRCEKCRGLIAKAFQDAGVKYEVRGMKFVVGGRKRDVAFAAAVRNRMEEIHERYHGDDNE